MNMRTDNLQSVIDRGEFKTCVILHEAPTGVLDLPNVPVSTVGGVTAHVLLDSVEDILIIEISGSSDPNLYRDVSKILAQHQVTRVTLVTIGNDVQTATNSMGKIASNSNQDRVFVVTDHVACQYPGPYTGTTAAARGEAFYDMNNAYTDPLDHLVPGSRIFQMATNRHASTIVWHSGEKLILSEQEEKVAIAAGCPVSSPYVTPWAMVMKAKDIRFSAIVITDQRN